MKLEPTEQLILLLLYEAEKEGLSGLTEEPVERYYDWAIGQFGSEEKAILGIRERNQF